MTTLLWDIAHSSGATLSLGDTKATIDNNDGPGQGGIRANIGKTAGKWYFEVDVVLYDGIAIGATTADGTHFPGLDANSVGFNASGYYSNLGGGFSSNGGHTVNINASMRLGVKMDLDNHTIELISAGSHGNDPVSFTTGGLAAYPSIGTGFGGGTSHVCSAIIYGENSEFSYTRDPDFLALNTSAPTAAFSGTPLTGEVSLSVDFTDESTGSPTSWLWSFGDGSTSTSQNPTHVYATPGTYTVSLVATNVDGSDEHVEDDYVEALPILAAVFNVRPNRGDFPFAAIMLDISSSGDSDVYDWNFGDGSTHSTTNGDVAHTFAEPGVYVVTLTITRGMETSTFTQTITVLGLRKPRVAWNNLAAIADGDGVTITCDHEAAGFEHQFALDWLDFTYWMPGMTGESRIEFEFDEPRAVNAFAFYGHNLGTVGATAKLQYYDDDLADWVDAFSSTPNGTEAVYKWQAAVLEKVKWSILIDTPSAEAFLGVVFFGEDFALEHGLWDGFTPPDLARETEVTNATSERGNWLGRQLLRTGSGMSIDPKWMSSSFARATWLPFIRHAELRPWFLLWNPTDYPAVAAFCLTDAAMGKVSYVRRDYMQTVFEAKAKLS